MPFGLCNAPVTFQWCMMVIFANMVEDIMEVFIDAFLVFGYSFDHCLHNLSFFLERCKEKNLILNWEKFHFMVQGGIVLGNRVSKDGLEVDTTKVSTIETLLRLTTVKGVRSFLGHVGFYWHIIKDFSKIVRPLCKFLHKDFVFSFDEACVETFNEIKKRLISAPIMFAPKIPFEIMCDRSDYTIGVVTG